MVLTGLLHLVFKGLGAKGLFIALAGTSWIGYVLWQVRQDPTKWKRWGFRTDNLRQAFMWPSVLCVASGLVMAWYGVNYVLGAGLHSYGFGGGGATHVLSACALDLGFVFLCLFFYRKQKAKSVKKA